MKNEKKIKAILFDIDNTLIDFMKYKKESCESAIDSMIKAGLKIKKEEALEILFKLYDLYGIEYQQIFQKFLKRVNGKIDYKIMARGIVAYRKTRENLIVPYSGATETLLKLKKDYRLAVISDAPIIQAWMRIVTVDFDNLFEVVITKGDVKKQKDSKTPFRIALKRLNLSPDETVMIGDRISRDINTAKGMGIKTCYARYGDINKSEIGKSGADWEINDIRELPSLLEAYNKTKLERN